MNIHLQFKEIFLALRQSSLLKSIALKSRVTVNCNNILSLLQKILDATTVLMANQPLDRDLNLVLKSVQTLLHHILSRIYDDCSDFFYFAESKGNQ